MNTATLCAIDPTIAELKLDEQRRSVLKRSVVLPDEVRVIRQRVEYAARVYEIVETVPHTDNALLMYFGCKPDLGGRVERFGADVRVIRHTS